MNRFYSSAWDSLLRQNARMSGNARTVGDSVKLAKHDKLRPFLIAAARRHMGARNSQAETKESA